MVSILGKVADMFLNALSCLRRSRMVACTHSDRVLMSHIGSHGLSLTAFATSDILRDDAGKGVGIDSLEDSEAL